jgi:hypothetical protein
MKTIIGLLFISFASFSQAESLIDYLTDANGKYIGPSVEDQIALMDKDHNGFADVYEVRAYLELQHGKGYAKSVLDRWQASATAKSCGTSFVNELSEK